MAKKKVKKENGAHITELQSRSPFFRLFSWLVYWLTSALCLLVNTSFFRIKVTGRINLQRLDSKAGCFVISNHSLYLDPAFIAHAIYPHRALFAASPMHFKIPVFKTYLRLLGAFPLPPKNGILEAAPLFRQALAGGLWIHFFPEGKLNPFGKVLQDFKWGVFTLAHDLKLPVLPVTIITRPWNFLGYRLPRPFYTIKVDIGRPIYPARLAATGVQTRLARYQAIRQLLAEAQTSMAASLRAG